MRLYPQLLAMPVDPSDQDQPMFKLMVASLTMLFMGHCKSFPLMKPFIEAGGLRALVDLLSHPNLHIVGQAMNTLLLITDGETRLRAVGAHHAHPGREGGASDPPYQPPCMQRPCTLGTTLP